MMFGCQHYRWCQHALSMCISAHYTVSSLSSLSEPFLESIRCLWTMPIWWSIHLCVIFVCLRSTKIYKIYPNIPSAARIDCSDLNRVWYALEHSQKYYKLSHFFIPFISWCCAQCTFITFFYSFFLLLSLSFFPSFSSSDHNLPHCRLVCLCCVVVCLCVCARIETWTTHTFLNMMTLHCLQCIIIVFE